MRAADRYHHFVEPLARFPAGSLLAVVAFVVAAGIGGRAGIAMASAWVAVSGTYCVLNFLHCGETHCAVTGLGWTLAALLGFAAAAMPGESLGWYRPPVEAAVFVAVLAIGYALEAVLAAPTEGHRWGHEDGYAEGR